MKFPIPLALLCALAGLSGVAVADTLKLKSGVPPIEGRVIKKNADGSVEFEYNMTPTIKDRKVFKKDDIAELIEQTPDELDFEPLKKLLPTGDLWGVNDYEKPIREKLEPYMAKHAKSKLVPQVQAILKTYQEELDKIKKGYRKLNGQWITPEEQGWNSYVIDAQILTYYLKQDLAKKDVKSAIDKISKLEKEYVATPSYVEALEQYDKLLDEYEKDLLVMAQAHPQLMADQKKELDSLDNPRRAAKLAAIKLEEDALKAKNAEEKQLKIPIPSVLPRVLGSIQQAQAAVKSERTRLAKVDKAKARAASDAVVKALQDLQGGNPQAAYSLFDQAAKIYSSDAKLRSMRDQAKKAADEAAKVRPLVAPTAPTPASTGAAKTPGAATSTDAKKTASTGAATPAASGTDAKKPAAAVTASAAPPPDEEANYGSYLLLAAGVLLAAGLGYMVIKKRRMASEAAEE